MEYISSPLCRKPVMLEIKISLVHIKKMLASVSPNLCYESLFTQCATYIIPWFTCLIPCLIYIHMTETCLKLILLLYFCHSKNLSNIMKNIFNSIFIYEKNLFVNKYKKQMCYKEKTYLFFDVTKNG